MGAGFHASGGVGESLLSRRLVVNGMTATMMWQIFLEVVDAH